MSNHCATVGAEVGVLSKASLRTRPSARDILMPVRCARVGARSAGVAGAAYLPARMPQPIRITGTRESYQCAVPWVEPPLPSEKNQLGLGMTIRSPLRP